MRKPLTKNSKCHTYPVFGQLFVFVVLTSSPRIDGPLITMLLISGALVFIPIAKSMKNNK